jgi:hypothetical protein
MTATSAVDASAQHTPMKPPVAQLGQVNGEKSIVGTVTYQHEKGTQEKHHRVPRKQANGIMGLDGPPRTDSGDRGGSHGLGDRDGQHQGDNDAHVITVDHLADNDHHEDKSDRSPGPRTAVAVFGLTEHIHGKRFEKRDDGRVKGAIDDGDDQHESKIGGKEEKRPQAVLTILQRMKMGGDAPFDQPGVPSPGKKGSAPPHGRRTGCRSENR